MSDPRIHVSLAHLRQLQGKARGLSFLPNQPSASVLNGRHASRLRGRGLNFEEMRDYLPGDDVRSIDWKATARTGSPHVRVFTEERDRPALLVVDQRISMFFGSQLNMKSVSAAEAAAIAAFRILDAGDRVGGIVFNDDEQLEFKPRRSRRSVYALLEATAQMNGELYADKAVVRKPESLNGVLQSAVRLAHHDHLVIVMSDFDGINEQTHRHVSNLARHNDLIIMHVHDPAITNVGARGKAVLGNVAQQAEVDFSSQAARDALNQLGEERLQRIYDWQKEIKMSVVPLSAGDETLPQIRRLLASAGPRRRVR
ncbi:MAG: DUF58 domain-containing protein [Woeseiaceae bacterium]